MPPTPVPIDTRSWEKKDRRINIERFAVTAVIMRGQSDPDDETKKLIHWRGAGGYRIDPLEKDPLKEAWRSTSFDTRKVENNQFQVQFISKPFLVSHLAPFHWQTPLVTGIEYTANQVYDLLKARNFNHYSYNGNGSGCLTWTTELVGLLEDEGVLPQGSRDAFEAKVEEFRSRGQYWVPEEPGAEFYDS